MTQLSLTLPTTPAEIARSRLGARKPVLSLSGGADSAAASLYLRELEIDHTRLNMDTVWEKQEHYEYLHGELARVLGPITEIRAELGFADLVRKKGLFPSRVMRFCTTELKVLPAQRFLNALVEEGHDIVNVVGIRHDESKSRSRMPEWEWSDGFDCEVWRPIVRWTKQDVWDILKRHGLDPNPLYAMGATRVGCWPCIHARKSEIALVARIDPARIDEIEALEHELNEKGRARDEAMGRPFVMRTMFSYHGGDSKHYPLPIRDAVEWANSKRGEWQPSGGDGCARFGLCERPKDDDGIIVGPPAEVVARAQERNDQKTDAIITDSIDAIVNGCACADCGHEQPTMDPCAKCGSVRTALVSVIEQTFGKDWRRLFSEAAAKKRSQ